jgi:transcriptional regulator with XRE-family HTH domain
MTYGQKPPAPYAIELGRKLRALRTELGMSLGRVEELSHGQYKAVVVGSWERGERSLTVEKLAGLCAFYRVPVTDLLPGSPLVAEAFAAMAATKDIEMQAMTEFYEGVIDSLRVELTTLRAQLNAEIAS